MQITAYRRKLQELIADLPMEAERLCIAQAQSGLTIVKNRSTNRGIFINSEDGQYAEYSTQNIPSWFFQGRQRNQAGAEHIKKNRLTTWHEFRKAQGLTNEKVNLSYTNRMWTSLGIVRTARIEGDGFMTVIGSSDPLVDKYLPYLRKRYGNFINPTATESDDLKADTVTDILQFIKRRL
jgi:hypothetical protein